MLEKDTLSLLRGALESVERGYASLPAFGARGPDSQAIGRVLDEVARRLRDDAPFFHPLYAGQMQQPPHEVARLAYALALWLNPNNHAPAGGRASSRMEREAVRAIARFVGWRRFAGHLCGGGTIANAEALWVASRTRPGAAIVASDEAHYSHRRMSRVLRLPFETLACDGALRIDVDALTARLARGNVGTVVATLGTTASGSVDALPELLKLRERHGFRLHVDAAYGGYFGLAENLREETRLACESLVEADSVVIDPHKHGLQPYGCSCVLFRDPEDGRHFRCRSPCSTGHERGASLREIGFECSRPGAAAVALWATMRLLPLRKGGEFAAMLRAAREAAIGLHERLRADARFGAPLAPDLDIVIFALRAPSADEASARARDVVAECARRDVHLSLAEVPSRIFGDAAFAGGRDRMTCVRATLMKADHPAWIGRIFDVISRAGDVVLAQRARHPRGPRAGATPRATVPATDGGASEARRRAERT